MSVKTMLRIERETLEHRVQSITSDTSTQTIISWQERPHPSNKKASSSKHGRWYALFSRFQASQWENRLEFPDDVKR